MVTDQSSRGGFEEPGRAQRDIVVLAVARAISQLHEARGVATLKDLSVTRLMSAYDALSYDLQDAIEDLNQEIAENSSCASKSLRKRKPSTPWRMK